MKFILLPRQNLFKNISTRPVFSGDAFEHWTIGFHPSTVEWCNCLRRIIGLNMASAHLGWLPAFDGIPSKLWWKLGRSLQYKAAWVPKQNLEVLVMSFEPFFVGDVFTPRNLGKNPVMNIIFAQMENWAMKWLFFRIDWCIFPEKMRDRSLLCSPLWSCLLTECLGLLVMCVFWIIRILHGFLRAPLNTPVWYIHFFSRCLVWKHVLESIDIVK